MLGIKGYYEEAGLAGYDKSVGIGKKSRRAHVSFCSLRLLTQLCTYAHTHMHRHPSTDRRIHTCTVTHSDTHTTLHYTTLHYTTLYYTTLHYTSHTRTHARTHSHARARVHTHTQALARTYTHTHTHTHYTTLHYTTLHYTTLHYPTLYKS